MESSDPYLIAKAGGKHHGLYLEYMDKPAQQIERAVRNIQGTIEKHRDKILNPDLYLPEWAALDARHQYDLLVNRWPREVLNLEEQKSILEGILSERTP